MKVAGFVVMAALAGVARAQEKAEPNWPQWRGPKLDGQSSDVPKAWSPPKLLWQQALAGAAYGSPSVAGGVVVVTDHKAEKEDYYRAYDAATGKELWTYTVPNTNEIDYGAAPRGTPLIYKGKVYVCGAPGDVHCIDAKTGKPVWKKDFLTDFGGGEVPTWGFCSALVQVGGNIIAMPGGTRGRCLVALNGDTGATVWAGKGSGANYSNLIAGTFGGVEQIIGYDAGGLRGWNAKTGESLWTLEVDVSKGYIVPSPVAVGGKVLLASEDEDTRLYGFKEGGKIVPAPEATNGELAPEMSTPTVAGELVLGLSQNGLICMDPANKLKTLWKDGKERAFMGSVGFVVATNGRALVIGDPGILALITVDKGGVKVLGTEKVCKGTQCHPALVGNRIYFRDSKNLYCYQFGGAK